MQRELVSPCRVNGDCKDTGATQGLSMCMYHKNRPVAKQTRTSFEAHEEGTIPEETTTQDSRVRYIKDLPV